MSSKSSFTDKIKNLFSSSRKQETTASFNQRQEKEKAYEAVERGTTLVPLDQIIGSVGRYHDFDHQFKTAHHGIGQRSERLNSIFAAMKAGRVLPPIALYQIKDDYYILDGHHRFQAAKELGYTEIRSKIVELLPSDNSLESILYREKTEFKDKYSLPEAITLTEPGQFACLDWQIAEHHNYLKKHENKKTSFTEAALDWYQTIYQPLFKLIKKSHLLEAFPGRTEGDLYLYISMHQWQQGKQRKYGIKFDKLIPTDMETFRMNMMERETNYPEMQREITVFMLLNIEGKAEDALLEKMKALPEIREIYDVHGTFDMMIKLILHRDLLSSDAELVTRFTQETIRQWKGIISTHTLIPGMAIIKDKEEKIPEKGLA